MMAAVVAAAVGVLEVVAAAVDVLGAAAVRAAGDL